MEDQDLLSFIFIDEGKKHGLDQELLEKVLKLLIRDQFIPKGKRTTVQAELERLVRQYYEGE